MARRKPAEACMFCDMGECDEHAPKPKSTPNKTTPRKAQGLPPADSRPTRDTPDQVSDVRAMQKTAAAPDDDEVMAEALRCFLRGGLLPAEAVRANRILIGPEHADPYIRADDWRRKHANR